MAKPERGISCAVNEIQGLHQHLTFMSQTLANLSFSNSAYCIALNSQCFIRNCGSRKTGARSEMFGRLLSLVLIFKKNNPFYHDISDL